LQLDRQQLAIPSGFLGQPVVRDDIGPLVGGGEVRKPQRRNGLNAQELCGFDAPVPGNDLPSVVDKDRVGVAEAFDAFGNLPDLCLGMGAGTRWEALASSATELCEMPDRARGQELLNTSPTRKGACCVTSFTRRCLIAIG
jgi:hypothetical protein